MVATSPTPTDTCTVELTCQHDGHTFYREPSRGRRPRFCPEHAPVVVSSDASAPKSVAVPKGPVKLYCQNGDHEWERPASRGRRPTSCPKHSTQPSRTSSAPKNTEKAKELAPEKHLRWAKAFMDNKKWFSEYNHVRNSFARGEITHQEMLDTLPAVPEAESPSSSQIKAIAYLLPAGTVL